MFSKPKKRESRRKREAKQYRTARVSFLRVHPWCQVGVKCTKMLPDPWGELREYPGTATEVHHVQGRGENYLDEGTWLAVCHECHAFLHANPAWSYENGFMERRNVNE